MLVFILFYDLPFAPAGGVGSFLVFSPTVVVQAHNPRTRVAQSITSQDDNRTVTSDMYMLHFKGFTTSIRLVFFLRVFRPSHNIISKIKAFNMFLAYGFAIVTSRAHEEGTYSFLDHAFVDCLDIQPRLVRDIY